MAQAMGYKARVILGFETTYNDSTGVTCVALPINSSGLKSKQNMTEAQTITGLRDPVMPALGNIDVSGQVVAPVSAIETGYWLKSLLGAPTSTGSVTFTHIYTTRATSVPSAVIEQQFADISVFELFNGCKVSSLSMNLGGDGELTMNLDLVGGKETVSGTAVVATATAVTFTRFDNFHAQIKEGGATVVVCTACELKLDSGLDTSLYVIGSGGFRNSLPEGNIGISGSITALFEDLTLINKAINGTESSLEILLTNGANSLKFEINELMYERNSPGIEGPKGVVLNMPFKGYWQDNASATACKVTLINTHAGY